MEKLFTKQQVADYLEVSVRTVDRLFDDIKFPVYHIRHQVRIPQSSVDLFNKSNKK